MPNLVERMEQLSVGPDSLAIFGLGQSGVVLRGPSGTIYIDPYLTDNGGGGSRLERLFPPPIAPGSVTNAGVALITHDHIDHFDPATLAPLAESSPDCVFIGPDSCDFALAGIADERVIRPPALEPLRLGAATVTAIPAAHVGLDKTQAGYPYLGYVVEWNGVTVYHAGDTVIYDEEEASGTPALLETLKRWSIDVMFVPINGRDYFRSARGLVGNTNEREAAELAEVLDVALVIPVHYDLIAANSANPAHFVDLLYRINPRRSHHLLRPGEQYLYVS